MQGKPFPDARSEDKEETTLVAEGSQETAKDHCIIVTKNLCRNFGDTAAVRNLNLQVKYGEIFGLVGPDGAGKTTTLRMLTGILEPTSGELWVDGISVREDPEAIKDHIAYMPQRFGLYQDLTVMENLTFYADLFRVSKKDRVPRIERLLGFSRLGPFKDRLAGALSGGMKQKLGLACALIHSPRLLLLDEPTNGVDPVSRRDFWKILYDLLKEGITIVVSTAYLDESERTTRVGLMHRGALIRLGEPRALKALVAGVMLELVPSDVPMSRKVLDGLPEILSANVFGSSLHLRVEQEKDGEVIREQLRQGGVHVSSLRRITPSMEDAFLWLISTEDRPTVGTGVR
jgi:ABC-2 type transport system ATP-binding protein